MRRAQANALFRRFRASESGASLIEYSIVISLFLLIFFAILDFGRLGFNWVMTEKAMQRAARIAVTRAPICPGVPETHTRGSLLSAKYGNVCRKAAGVCASEATVMCTFNASETLRGFSRRSTSDGGRAGYEDDCAAVSAPDTATEIWCTIWPILPSNATPRNIRASYTFDDNLGFLGGPYTPMVELAVVTAADLTALTSAGENNAPVAMQFDFITPLPGLAAMLGGGTPSHLKDIDSDSRADIPFPDLSVSMPGEDLSQGNSG